MRELFRRFPFGDACIRISPARLDQLDMRCVPPPPPRETDPAIRPPAQPLQQPDLSIDCESFPSPADHSPILPTHISPSMRAADPAGRSFNAIAAKELVPL